MKLEMTTERNAEGAWVVTALVTDDATGFDWYESRRFYGYSKRAAMRSYRESIAGDGLRAA